jgi:hypothetical protein
MHSDRWTGAWTGAHMRLGCACPNLFFSVKGMYNTNTQKGHAHSSTYWHRIGGEEGMHNRVEELLKGGQR